MTLREIIDFWKAGGAKEAVRSRLWDSWREVSQSVANNSVYDFIGYDLPEDANGEFTEIFAEVAAEQSILEMEANARLAQTLIRAETRVQDMAWPDLSALEERVLMVDTETIRPQGQRRIFNSVIQSSGYDLLRTATETGRWSSAEPNIPEGVRRIGGGISAAFGPTEFIGEFPRRETSPVVERTLNSLQELARDLLPVQVVPHQRQQTAEERARARNRDFGLRYGMTASRYAELFGRPSAEEQPYDPSHRPPQPEPIPEYVLECFELQEGEELEIVARATSNVSPKVKKKAYGDPIYTWGLLSSKPRNGGEHITYEVRLEDDGSIRCNCPGWVFMKKGAQRACKHTREVELEAKDFFKKHGNGEQLPTTLPTDEQVARLKSNKKTESKVGAFGRILDFD